MGISDKLGNLARKAQELTREHPEQTEQALNKAEHIVDQKTGGKYSEQLDKVAEQLKQRLGEQGHPQ
jgi:conjugal transfer/entry exclusion protein